MEMGNRFLLTSPEFALMNSKHIYLKSSLTVLFIFLSFPSYLFSQSVDSLVGNWELIKNSRQWDVDLRFRENREFFVQQHLYAKYKYELNGDTLISFLQTSYPDSETIIDTSFITVKKDTIIKTYSKSGKTNTIVMIKDKSYPKPKKKTSNPIVGRWKWMYPSKDTAVETFHNDKTWDFSVSKKMYSGNWEVNRDTLVMTYDNTKKTKKLHTFWIQENMLGIRDLKTDKEYLYRRTKP